MTLVSHAGQLLVASPLLGESAFAQAVVFLLDHDADGALGVVLNRPTPVPVAQVLPTWQGFASGPDVLFQGGPVALDNALALGSVPGTEEPLGWRRVLGPLGLVDLDTPPELLAADLHAMRIFAGYAGWSPGQLEDELAEDAWFLVDAAPGDVFSGSPAALWRAVLRRQRGAVALLSGYVEDPTRN